MLKKNRRKYGRFNVPAWLKTTATIGEKKTNVGDISYGGLKLAGEFEAKKNYHISLQVYDMIFSAEAMCVNSFSGNSGFVWDSNSLIKLVEPLNKILPYADLGSTAHQIKPEDVLSLEKSSSKAWMSHGPIIFSYFCNVLESVDLEFILQERGSPPSKLTLDPTNGVQLYRNLTEKESPSQETIRKLLIFVSSLEIPPEHSKPLLKTMAKLQESATF